MYVKGKMKRTLSIMLIVTMLMSLFAGTAMAKGGRSIGKLFPTEPTVLVTEGGEQIPQRFKISGVVIASGGEANYEATPSGAIDNLKLLPSEDEIEIIPYKLEKPEDASAIVSLSYSLGGSAQYRSNVTFAWNWFKNSSMSLGEGNKPIILEQNSTKSSYPANVTFTSKPDILDIKNILGEEVQASLKKDSAPEEETDVMVTMKAAGKVIGLCTVTVFEDTGEEPEPEPESFAFFADKSVEVYATESVDLKLTDSAISLLNDDAQYGRLDFESTKPEVAEIYKMGPATTNKRIEVKGFTEGETEVTVIYTDESGKKQKDICKIIVKRNFVNELAEALSGIDNIDPGTEDGKAQIKSAVVTIIEVTKAINSDDSTALNNLETEEAKDTLRTQMDMIGNLERLLAEANPHITIEEPDISPTLNKISNFECIGAGLNVNPQAGSKTYAQLAVAEGTANPSGVTLSPDAVSLDITLNVFENSSLNKAQQPKAPLQISMDIPEGLNDNIVIYHVHGSKTDSFTPEIIDGKIVFYATQLSTFIIDRTEETVMYDVLVENVKGGYITAYSERNNNRTYVPIGTKVKVPAGTELQLRQKRTGSTPNGITVASGGTTTQLRYNSTITVEDNTVITGKFNPVSNSGEGEEDYLYFEFDMIESPDERSIEEKLKVYYYDEQTDTNVYITPENIRIDTTFVDDNLDTSLFSLSEQGVLKSKDTLSYGEYAIPISFEYNNKTYGAEELGYGSTNFVYVYIGRSVGFSMYLGQDTSNNHNLGDYLSYRYVKSGTSLADIIAKENITVSMYGGYAFDGWYDSKKVKVDPSSKVNNDISLYAMFKKDGSFYNAEIQRLGDSTTPTPPPTGKPSGGGGGGGGSSTTKPNYTMNGNWIQDATGWKFTQNNGQYAKNQWGLINGAFYYFNNDGLMATGWTLVNNEWYYLNPLTGSTQGMMQIGWAYSDEYKSWFYLSPSGAMMTGWQLIDGKWYYLNPNSDGTKGSKVVNQWIGQYFVDENGVWAE